MSGLASPITADLAETGLNDFDDLANEACVGRDLVIIVPGRNRFHGRCGAEPVPTHRRDLALRADGEARARSIVSQIAGLRGQQLLLRSNASNNPRYRLLEAASRCAQSSVSKPCSVKYIGGQHDNDCLAVYRLTGDTQLRCCGSRTGRVHWFL